MSSVRPISIFHYFIQKLTVNFQFIMTEMCSLNFKALERPWTEGFKRYFLGPFVDNLFIIIIDVLVQEATILIRRFSCGSLCLFVCQLVSIIWRSAATETKTWRCWEGKSALVFLGRPLAVRGMLKKRALFCEHNVDG